MKKYPVFGVSSFLKLIAIISLVISCSTVKKSGLMPEDELFVTRKYVGNFLEYTSSSPYYRGGPHVISIKTTLDTIYGNITAYSKKCDFQPGDRLYIRKVYLSPSMFGNWKYQIENDREKPVSYEIKEFRYGDKVLVQNWF